MGKRELETIGLEKEKIMFNKKKKVQESFKTINNHIDSLTLSDDEKRNLKGLLRNVKIRTGVA